MGVVSETEKAERAPLQVEAEVDPREKLEESQTRKQWERLHEDGKVGGTGGERKMYHESESVGGTGPDTSLRGGRAAPTRGER